MVFTPYRRERWLEADDQMISPAACDISTDDESQSKMLEKGDFSGCVGSSGSILILVPLNIDVTCDNPPVL